MRFGAFLYAIQWLVCMLAIAMQTSHWIRNHRRKFLRLSRALYPQNFGLCERIFRRIQHTLRLVVIQILHRHADILEYLIQSLSEMSECHSAVMRIVLLYQHMAVEASHLGNGEYSDAAEGFGCHRKHLSLGNVSAKLIVGR